jgi:hypothetical protein
MPDFVPNRALKEFWDREVAPIMRSLATNSYGLPEIQARHFELLQTIADRYHHELSVSILDKRCANRVDSKYCLPFGCRALEGIPEVAIFVPVVKEIFLEIRKKSPAGFRRKFETTLVIGFLHELDHLALGLTCNDPSFDAMLEVERVVWSWTCERTINVFAETYKRELCHSDRLYYDNWLRCGRNADSPCWRSFIANLYGSIRLG